MCGACNRRHNVDPEPYISFMKSEYGKETIEELRRLRESLTKVTDEELKMLLEQYRSIA